MTQLDTRRPPMLELAARAAASGAYGTRPAANGSHTLPVSRLVAFPFLKADLDRVPAQGYRVVDGDTWMPSLATTQLGELLRPLSYELRYVVLPRTGKDTQTPQRRLIVATVPPASFKAWIYAMTNRQGTRVGLPAEMWRERTPTELALMWAGVDMKSLMATDAAYPAVSSELVSVVLITRKHSVSKLADYVYPNEDPLLPGQRLLPCSRRLLSYADRHLHPLLLVDRCSVLSANLALAKRYIRHRRERRHDRAPRIAISA
jgi:hypothetical protein